MPVEYEAEFRRNPEKAKRDLAALPGTAFQPYFVDMTPVEQAVTCGCGTRWRARGAGDVVPAEGPGDAVRPCGPGAAA